MPDYLVHHNPHSSQEGSMIENKRFTFLLLTGLTLVLLVRTLILGVAAKKTLLIEAPQSIGMGRDLLALVNDLENVIGSRFAYEVKIKNDPLKLDRIVSGGRSAIAQRHEVKEAGGQLRLSCTILSPEKSTAIIKYKGESHVVTIGQSVAGRRVVAIDQKKVVLDDNGKQIVLFNRPEPVGTAGYHDRIRLNDLEL